MHPAMQFIVKSNNIISRNTMCKDGVYAILKLNSPARSFH